MAGSCVGYSRANENFFLLRIGDFHDAVDENAGRDDMLGVDLAGSDDLGDWAMVVAAAMHISGLKLRPALL